MVVALLVVAVVVKSPVCAGAAINMLTEVLEISVRAAVVIDVFTCVMNVIGVDTLADVKIVAVAAVVVALEFAVLVPFSVDLLSGAVADVLDDVNVSALAIVMTALAFAMAVPFEASSH